MTGLDRRTIGVGVAVIVAIATGGALVASSSPDGLERVAADLGFSHREVTVYEAPLPDYGARRSPLRTAIVGLVGAGVVGGLAYGAGRLLARRP